MARDTVQQDVRDECNTLTRKMAQLQAMLSMTYGDAKDSFDGMSDEIQDNFMWACSDLADECFALSETVSATVHRQRAGCLRILKHDAPHHQTDHHSNN